MDGKRTSGIRREISVTDADLKGIELTMQPAAEVPGRIRVEGDAHIEFRKLWLNPAGRETDRVLRVEPAADGTMLIDGLQPDVYTLPVYGMPPQFYFKSERQGERDLLALGLDTSLSTGPVEIVLSPDGGEVAGTAAAGATVVLAPIRSAAHRFSFGRIPPPMRRGDFCFAGWRRAITGSSPGRRSRTAAGSIRPCCRRTSRTGKRSRSGRARARRCR